MKIHYCSQCGSDDVCHEIPDGDSRPRYICKSCQFIHYSNPNVVAGCVVTHEGKILLCRRAIEPRKGLWTLPGGFMENHETVAAAAMRETWEEARANVKLKGLFTIFNLPHINQVYMMYRAELVGNSFAPGLESLEVELVRPDEIPWEQLAFATIRETLKLFIHDMKHDEFRFHCGDIIRPWVLEDSRDAYLTNLVSR